MNEDIGMSTRDKLRICPNWGVCIIHNDRNWKR